MEFDPALQTYIAESRELLEEMEDALLRLEQEDDKLDSLNAIFRAAHTIKGSAGLFGLDNIVAFTHGVEGLLDRLREGTMQVNEDIAALLLTCRDHINELIDRVEMGDDTEDAVLQTAGAELTAKLQELGIGTKQVIAREQDTPTQSAEVERLDDDTQVDSNTWHISLRFGENSLRDGMDPISFIRYLGTLGDIVNMQTIADALPDAREMDPESCYLGFEIAFNSDADKQTIEDVFEFVREDSQIRIVPPSSQIVDFIELIEGLPEEDMKLGEMLVQCGTLTESELQEALRLQEANKSDSAPPPLGNIVVEAGMAEQQVIEAAVEKQSRVRDTRNKESQSVRVNADKLDQLINLIGELVIAGAGTALNTSNTGDSVLMESVSTLNRLVEEVRDATLRLRMVQIGATFNRFRRVVRDVSNEMGKEIDLVITGAETELDKTVIEKIGDPLMHLVRNSVDHGIEPAEERKAKGKPTKGILRLNAYHDSGSIVIEVSDDGAGLNKERILNKAIEKGIVSEEQQLEDQEIYNLIFEAGFSTADSVTNLSGRGVGMDVVRRNIESLRGTVELESAPEEGTTFRVRLPLTLAIIDGFHVGVQNSSFVIPLEMVLECVELDKSNHEINADRNYINLRGEVLPFISLRDLFDVGGHPPRRQNLVVVRYGGNKAGIVIDELFGELQTVIKPLGPIFSHINGISGSTILGNGEVALIIDVLGLVQQVSSTSNWVSAA